MDNREIQQILKENEEKYRIAFKTSPNAISISDLNGIYKDVNNAFLEILEFKENEVIGKSATELGIWANSKDREKLIGPIKQHGFIKNLELQFKTRTGKLIHGLLSAHIIVLSGIPYVLSVTRDITERKKTSKILQNALRKEQEFANIVRNAPMAIAVAKLDGTVLSFNQAGIDLLGYSKKELQKTNWKTLTPPKWAKLEEKKLAELIKTRKNISYEKEYIKKDGTTIPVEVVISGIFDKNGKLTKLIGFISNITQRKETERIMANNQLLKAVGEMASSVAHDFNNSLQAIIGNIELLRDLEEITPKIKEHLEIIYSAANDASERVKLLQRLGDKKQVKNKFSSVSLNHLLDEVILQTRPLWKGQMEKNGLQIKINKNYQKNIKITGNIGELRSVFYNIIKNSIEAMPAGGEIDIITAKNNKNVIIEISDNGEGMSKEVISHIFQPFYSTKGFGIGRGLGLSGAYSVIQEHNGTISLDSELNKGTKFTITLPYIKSEVISDKKNHRNEYLKKLAILLVDDEIILQKLGKKALGKMGHIVDTVSSGTEALNLLKNKKYDILITDIGMPEMNGWQLIENINENIKKTMKIIILTGWGGEISPEKLKSYKVSAILEKPITIEQMKETLSKVMEKK